jgi:phage shock protein A
MTITRFSIGSGTVLLSILGLLLCLAGIVGVWMVKERVEAVGNAICAAADESLVFVDAKIDRVKEELDKSRQRVSGISKLAERLRDEKADARKEAEPLLQSLNEVFEQLKAAESWLESSLAAAQGVSRVSQAVVSSQYAAAHEGSTGVEIAQRVQEASEKVAEALATLQVVRREIVHLRDTGKLVREVAARVIARVADLDGRLATISARLEKFDTKVANTKASIGNLQRRIHWWIAVTAVAITVLSAWFGISQIGMMCHGYRTAIPRRLSLSNQPHPSQFKQNALTI